MVKDILSLKRNTIILLFCIVVLASFMRFYNLYPWLMFGMDQEYQALISQNIVTGHHIPLIGVNASDTGIYLGPFFSYLAAIIFAISGGSPVCGAVFSSLIGVITVLTLFFVTRAMFTEKVAIFASFLYAGSFLVSFYDRQFWNPNPVPLLSILTLYLLWRIYTGKIKFLPWLAVIFGIGIQCHLSMLIYIPLIGYVLYTRCQNISKKILLLSFGLYLLIQSPWIVFEFRHDFLNTNAVISILNGKTASAEYVGIIPRIVSFISTSGRLLWVPLSPDLYLESGQCRELKYLRKDNFFLGSIITVFLLWFVVSAFKRKTADSALKFIVALFVCTGVYLLLYSRQSFEYYYLYMYPWFAVLLAYAVHSVLPERRYSAVLQLILVLCIVGNIATLMTAQHSYPYSEKISSLSWAKSYIGDSSYKVEALGGCARFGGYRYLSEFIIGVPVSSYMDSYFSWLYRADSDPTSASKTLLLDVIDPREGRTDITTWQEYTSNLSVSEILKSTERFGMIQASIYEIGLFAVR